VVSCRTKGQIRKIIFESAYDAEQFIREMDVRANDATKPLPWFFDVHPYMPQHRASKRGAA